MNAYVDQSAAAGTFLFRKPITNPDRDAARTNESRLCIIDFAEPAFVHHRLARGPGWCEARLPAKKINEISLLCLVPQHFHLRRVHRRRLFTQDVFAGFKGSERRRKMQKIRETNDDGINLSILQ